MRAGFRIPALLAWLTVLWVMLWGRVTVANVVGGLGVAVGVVLFARLDPVALRPTHFRPLWALLYVVTLVWKLLVSNVRLAYEILTPGDGTYTGIIAIRIRGGSDAAVNLVANSITLTPGTMTIDVERHDVDPDSPDAELQAGATLYVHGMYMRDVDAVRRDVLRLEALALHAFGSHEDYRRALDDVVALDRPTTTDRRGRSDA